VRMHEGVMMSGGYAKPMKPVEYLSTMVGVGLPSGVANGDMALPLFWQAVAIFLQKDVGQHGEGPEAHKSSGAHQLILVQAQFFLAISKEHLDVPPCGDVLEQYLWIRFQVTGSPIAGLRYRSI